MDERRFRLCRRAIAAAMGVMVGWSVASGNAVIPVVAAAGGMGLMYLCRKRLKAVIDDERNYRISEKAARLTIGILGPGMAVTAAVLIALDKGVSSGLKPVGLTLAYSACALALLHAVLYAYYERKS